MKKKFNINFIPVLTFIMLFSFMFSIQKAEALYLPDSYYNAISWTWTYDAPYTTSYNCLGYATGSMTWEWPSSWGEGATQSQVDSYLFTKVYSSASLATVNLTKIVAYGPNTNDITHFAKVTGLNSVTAKWGSLERFKQGSLNPYYSSSSYGLARRYYNKI